MIESAIEIGRGILDISDVEKRDEEFLTALTIRPVVEQGLLNKLERVPREIVLNLNTQKRLIEIKEENEFLPEENGGPEVLEKLRKKIFAFDIESSNSKKVFANTKNIDYLPLVLDHMIQRIEGDFTEKDSATGKPISQLPNLYENLKKWREMFCIEINDNRDQYFLDFRKTEHEKLKQGLFEFLAEKIYKQIKSKKDNDFEGLVSKKLLNKLETFEKVKEKKDFLSKFLVEQENYKITPLLKEQIKNNKKDYREVLETIVDVDLPCFSLKVDGEYFHEIDEIKSEYLKLVKNEVKNRFFKKNTDTAKNSVCSLCAVEKEIVTGKIDIDTKFYLKDKPNFFENLQEKNKWKSFSACEDCIEELLVGTGYIRHNLESQFFGSRFLIIPKNMKLISNSNQEKLNKIKKILDTAFNERKEIERIDHELKQHGRLIKKLTNINQRFDFMFFTIPSGQGASFKVIETVQDVEWRKIVQLIKELYTIQKSEFYEDFSPRISFQITRNLIFPSRFSHDNVPYDAFRKKLLIFLKRLVKHQKMDRGQLIRKFVRIHEKMFHHSDENQSAAEKLRFDYYDNERGYFFARPFHMFIFLSALKNLNMVKGEEDMGTEESFVQLGEIEPKLNEFFELHSDVFENSTIRRGLVGLGLLMHEILNRQLADEKTGTVMHKLNFGGIPHSRLKTFVCDIADMLTIYDIYRSEKARVILASVQEAVLNSEEDQLSPQENVFYILTGISVGRYIKHLNDNNGGD